MSSILDLLQTLDLILGTAAITLLLGLIAYQWVWKPLRYVPSFGTYGMIGALTFTTVILWVPVVIVALIIGVVLAGAVPWATAWLYRQTRPSQQLQQQRV